jgi:hypothetical protein
MNFALSWAKLSRAAGGLATSEMSMNIVQIPRGILKNGKGKVE